jgi:hypothetical protein
MPSGKATTSAGFSATNINAIGIAANASPITPLPFLLFIHLFPFSLTISIHPSGKTDP